MARRRTDGSLDRARDLYAARAWADAHEALTACDRKRPLTPDDLERLATTAYLIGRRAAFVAALERAHHGWLEAGEGARAAGAAFWIGLDLLLRAQSGPATGWLQRARRLVDQMPHETVQEGYLLVPVAEQQLRSGDHGAAAQTARDAAAIGERLEDPDLVAIARHVEGRALVYGGRIEDGLALLDEAMVAVTSDELSPIPTGLVYCSVIQACQEVHAIERAGQWTAAMARWCDAQPQMAAFTGVCLVQRAMILRLRGSWADALDEAERACRGYSQGRDERPPADAFYQQAEVHRLRGAFAPAEELYREASQWGCDPQPGLALLRLAEGRTDAASAAIRRAVGNAGEDLELVRLLPALVEISIATGDLPGARDAASRLAEVTSRIGTDALRARAAHARGAVALAAGDPGDALRALRTARESWDRIDAPYAAARARELIGRACRALGDDDGARLESEAARTIYARLGARPDLSRLEAEVLREGLDPRDASPDGRTPASARPHGLTPRELQVLRLVAAGKTNKTIAGELFVSERTVDRHVSNVFSKLRVSSRAAATAFAYENGLV